MGTGWVQLAMLAACGGTPARATPELLAHTWTVHIRTPCSAVPGCSGAGVTISCAAVLRLDVGDGWADCTDDFVRASSKLLSDGRAEIRFSPASGVWTIIATADLVQDHPPELVGSARGEGTAAAYYQDAVTSFTAERWP